MPAASLLLRCSLFPLLAPRGRGRAGRRPKPEDFVIVQKGRCPIIVSAPHGGRKKVPDVPERVGKGIANFQTVLDANTAELTEKLRRRNGESSSTASRGSSSPGSSASTSTRTARANSGYESEKAKPYYDAYHDSLEAACKAVKKKFGRGLLLDIHGQGEFRDAICRGTQNGKTVTLLKDRDGWAAITGKQSVLGHMERIGYKVLPTCDADEKTKEEPKFNGGHIVDTYGSHTGYAIDAIQLEFGSDPPREGEGSLREDREGPRRRGRRLPRRVSEEQEVAAAITSGCPVANRPEATHCLRTRRVGATPRLAIRSFTSQPVDRRAPMTSVRCFGSDCSSPRS